MIKPIYKLRENYSKLLNDALETIEEMLKNFPDHRCNFSEPIWTTNGPITCIYIDNRHIKICDGLGVVRFYDPHEFSMTLALMTLVDEEMRKIKPGMYRNVK